MFSEREGLSCFASTETKIKENGQILWLRGVDGVNSGVQKNEWAMKGVAQYCD